MAATHLDLSHNLLWHPGTVVHLVQQLPSLTTLDLSHNRLHIPLTDPPANQLRVLVLNATLLPWQDVLQLARCLPQLEELHVCSNRIRCLDNGDAMCRALPQLRVLDLDDNALDDWQQVASLQQLPSLTRLQLNGNALRSITPSVQAPQCGATPFAALASLSLGGNRIDSWASVDALASMTSLTARFNTCVCHDGGVTPRLHAGAALV